MRNGSQNNCDGHSDLDTIAVDTLAMDFIDTLHEKEAEISLLIDPRRGNWAYGHDMSAEVVRREARVFGIADRELVDTTKERKEI